MSMPAPLLAGLALAGVIALMLLVRRALLLLPRGVLPLAVAPGRGGALALEQVLALDARRRLVLVRCGGRRVLLLTGGAQDLLLGWLEPPS
jgi:flagellar protein FliO/FliZ